MPLIPRRQSPCLCLHRSLFATHNQKHPSLFAPATAYVSGRHQEDLNIEITGIAEENGTIGSLIHIRLTQLNSDESAMQIPGIVRGPLDVEMQP